MHYHILLLLLFIRFPNIDVQINIEIYFTFYIIGKKNIVSPPDSETYGIKEATGS